ncbi:MAG: hypothetical protein SNF93_06360, partial [Rikenellaceae bacterium]
SGSRTADVTNVAGYGNTSQLIQKAKITINASGTVFFILDQYPWVEEVEVKEDELDTSISTVYHIDNYGNKIYYNATAVGALRASDTDKYTLLPSDPDYYKLTFEMLDDIDSVTGESKYYNYIVDRESDAEVLIESSDEETLVFEDCVDLLDHLCFIRFIVNLTDDTQQQVEQYVSMRMKYNIFGDYNSGGATGLSESSYKDSQITTFDDYKHLSVGLDAYYQINVDELNGEAHGAPNPMGQGGNVGLMQEKYPMASPGFLMPDGVTASSLSDLNDLTAVQLVHVGSKVDVSVDSGAAADFTLHGVTLLNGAKRALMRSTVLANDGITEEYQLPLPTNYYSPEYNTPGVVQFGEVAATNNTTAAYPIYFFPNEGDTPNAEDGVDYDAEFDGVDNVSDPINGYNPTYLIIRGTFTQSGEEGYYKVPLKYENTQTDASTEYTYDILRHNYFQVTIISVANAGYKTFEEAAAGPASDLKYDITIGDESDDRNEYATSNGTFYIETDATEIFIKGYGNILSDDDSDADAPFSFNLTVVSNDELNDIDPLVTKAGDSYAIPDVYITASEGIELTDVYAGDQYYNTIGEPKSTLTYTPTSGAQTAIEFVATAQGVIKVQCGDIFKEIPVYYEAEDYVRAGSSSEVYPNSDSDARLAVNGVTAFDASNTIEYESDYTDIYNAYQVEAGAQPFGEFLTADGYVLTNVADENGGFFKRRECRAKVYRTQGRGIAKVYLKQASDFALLYGLAEEHESATTKRTTYEVGSTLTVVYNSRGYKYSVDGTITSGSDYNNEPFVFYIAGSDQSDEMGLETSDEPDNWPYNTTLSTSGETSRPVKSFRSGNTLYTIDADSQDEDDVQAGTQGYDFSTRSLEDANFGDDFSVWAYPILTNQTVPEDGSGWSYYEGFASVDNTTTITLRNSAGESKSYVLDFYQYALPFWDPTLTTTSSNSIPNDYVVCQHYVDAYDGNGNYSGSNVYGNAGSSAEGTHNAIAAFTVYNANYRRGDYVGNTQVWDFAWADSNYGDSTNASYISGIVSVQAYDDFEPEYVVFAAYTNVSSSTSETNARAYFTVTMSNDANESTTMYMQVNRNDTYCNTGISYGGATYTYLTFTYDTTDVDNSYSLLDYLEEPGYLAGVN